MRSLLLFVVLFIFTGCGGTAQKVDFQAEVERCQHGCDAFALGLILTRDYENALNVLPNARAELDGEGRLAFAAYYERSVVEFQLALLEVVAVHHMRPGTEPWSVLDSALTALVGAESYAALSRSTTAFVPPQDRIWLKTQLAKQAGALAEFGGVILAGWDEPLSANWTAKPVGMVRIVHLYLMSRSAIAGSPEFIEQFAALFTRLLAQQESDSLADLIQSRELVELFFRNARPEVEEVLRAVVEVGAREVAMARVVPIPGKYFRPLQGCEIAEPLLSQAARRFSSSPEELLRVAECLVRLGRHRFAQNTLLRLKLLGAPEPKVIELMLLNNLLGRTREPVPIDIEKFGTAEQKMILEAISGSLNDYETVVGKLPPSDIRDVMLSTVLMAKNQPGQALLLLGGLLSEYRSYRLAELAIKAIILAGRPEQADAIVAPIQKMNPKHGATLRNVAAAARNKEELIVAASDFINLDKQGSCHDLFVGLSFLVMADRGLALKTFDDWAPWLKARRSRNCVIWVRDFLANADPANFYLRLIQAVSPKDKRMDTALKTSTCAPEVEARRQARVAKEGTIEAFNALVWYQIWCERPVSDAAIAVLEKAKSASEVDTDAWRLYLAGRRKQGLERWSQIPQKDRSLETRIGLLAASTFDETSQEVWRSAWEEVAAELEWSQDFDDSKFVLEWAKACAAHGFDARATEMYDFLADFRPDKALRGLEKACPSCRERFQARHGHDLRVWWSESPKQQAEVAEY